MSVWAGAAVSGALGLAAWGVMPVVLRVLPEPELEPDDVKVPYRMLPARRLGLGAALWAVALALVTTGALPVVAWAPFLVVALVGSVGCAIDAATTWLPRRILHVGWGLTAVSLVGATVGGSLQADPAVTWAALGRAGAGALLTGGLFLVAHLVASFGLSDARLGLLTGGIAAWLSWGTLLTALLLGSAVGAVWGVAHAVRAGRSSPFPYGPSLLFGPYLAIAVGSLTQ